MWWTKAIGILLQILSVASFAAALAVLLLKKLRLPPGPLSLGENGRPAVRSHFRTFCWAAFAAVGSRLLLAALAYAALAVVNQCGSLETKGFLAGYGFDKLFPPLSGFFSRWDAPHYLDIAKIGYTSEHLPPPYHDQYLFIVFYPLYPALTALLSPLLGNVFNAATAISWACLAGACFVIYRLSMLDAGKGESQRAVKYLLIFPTAVFLGAPYTESLFLLLSALCLFALRKRRWWLAGVTGFFAALTRNLGALLILPFAVEALDVTGVFSDRKKLKTVGFWLELLKNGAWALLIPVSVGIYLIINQIAYGDPFMFLKIQDSWWHQHAQPFWRTVLTTWQCLAGGTSPDDKMFLWLPQMLGMAAVLVSLPFMARRLRPSYTAYLVAYAAVALSPSWLLSFNRYMMGAVPLLLGIAALTRRKWADIVLTVIFVAAMLFLAAGFFMWKSVY